MLSRGSPFEKPSLTSSSSTPSIAASSSADAGTSTELSEIQAALLAERELRQQHEEALEDALDEVMTRSAALQRRMEADGARIFPSSVGSPQKLLSLAQLKSTGPENDDDISEGGYESGGTADATAPELLQLQVASLHESLANSLQEQLSQQKLETSALYEQAEGQRAELEAQAEALEAAHATAVAASSVLQALLERSGSAEAAELLSVDAAHRGPAWFERGQHALYGWMDEQRRGRAAAALREERLHAELLEAKSCTAASQDDYRSRAERAEARSRNLVAALRLTQRSFVDAYQADQPLQQVDVTSHEEHERALGPSSELRRRHLSSMWQQEKVQARDESVAADELRRASKAAYRDQLLLPGRRPGSGGGGGDADGGTRRKQGREYYERVVAQQHGGSTRRSKGRECAISLGPQPTEWHTGK